MNLFVNSTSPFSFRVPLFCYMAAKLDYVGLCCMCDAALERGEIGRFLPFLLEFYWLRASGVLALAAPEPMCGASEFVV